jgi:hypothetical protein
MTALPRRSLLALAALTPFATLAQTEAGTPPLLAAGRLLVGVERLAKLRLEQGLLPERAPLAQRKALLQLEQALIQLRATPPRFVAALPPRRQSQLQATAAEVELFVAQAADQSVTRLFSDSEALVARLGFVSTALSGVAPDAQRAAQVDLFARAAGSALRVGKINFAAAALPQTSSFRVAAGQALIEFSSALDAVSAQPLSVRQRQDLQLAQQQWLLFRAALGADGLVRARERLADVATTTERIAESLEIMAQRAA